MRVYKYDVSGIDLGDCCKMMLLPVHVDTIPMILGCLKAITYERRHVSAESWAIGKAVYQELQEVLTVNECITDLLTRIADALETTNPDLAYLSNLACLCTQATNQTGGDQTIITETIYNNLQNNTDVDYSGQENPNYEQGEPPTEYNDERCQRAQAVFWNIYNSMDRVVNLQLGVAGVSSGAMVGIIAAFLTVPLPISIVLGLMTGITYVFVEQAVRDGITEWSGMAQEAICAIYGTHDMQTASAVLHTMVDNNITNVAARTYIKFFYGATLMGEMYQNANNTATFDGAYCQSCITIPTECIEIGACDLADWTGGSMICMDGYATNQGGLSRWTKQTITCPSNAYLTIGWIPKSDGYPVAKANFGVYRVSDTHIQNLIGAVDHPVNQLAIQSGIVSSYLWGQEIGVFIQQSGYWGQIIYWCITEGPLT